MKLKSCLSLCLCWCFFFAKAQSDHIKAASGKTQNIVVILIDGYRWQELFRGAELDLLENKKYNTSDSLQRIRKYWSDDVNERRKKLMPFTWNYIAKHGQLYGNRNLGNKVNVMNPYWFSYPGRAEVLSGFVASESKFRLSAALGCAATML